ncbi:MAG: hypothetical protein PHO86_01695 [Bacilli bacterium]|nr:hypothetical protein [Bacilli bacterium]
MSLIICVHVNEGIVLASDSRSTYNNNFKKDNKEIVQIGTNITDTTDKTFLCPNKTGISTCGDSSINGHPIAGYIQSFILNKLTKDTRIDDMPQMILDYFKELSPTLKTIFFVVGYQKYENHYEQRIYDVNTREGKFNQFDTLNQGAIWQGEMDILTKILNKTFINSNNGTVEIPQYDIAWNLFNLQDAINFAEFAIKTTIDTMSFQNRVKTVGGPIDILVIKPDESLWIKKKNLHSSEK